MGWPGWPDQGTHQYIIMDNAHKTYWDTKFWKVFIKKVQGHADARVRIILFCRYGSPAFCPANHPRSSPLHIPPNARISLKPQSDDDVGLLLTRTEFDEVVGNHVKRLAFDEKLQTTIYEWTAGHVGAVEVIIGFIVEKACLSYGLHILTPC